MIVRLLILLLILSLPALSQTAGETELRSLLKAPISKESGAYTAPESGAKLRALLKANPKLCNQPIFQLRGEKVSTPLVEAVRIGNVDGVRILLELKAKPNLALGDPEVPPLQVAISTRLPGEVRLSTVRLLLGSGANATTSLHVWAACTNWTDRKTYFAAADALVGAKTNVNSTNESGASPLQVAVVNDNVLAVEKLMALGAVADELVQDLAYAGVGTPEGNQILKILKLPVPRPPR